MANRIRSVFSKRAEEGIIVESEMYGDSNSAGKACFVGFMTAGFPSIEESPEILVAMQKGGVDIIELGVPFSDPLADGPTIQYASQVALRNGVDLDKCLQILSSARNLGLTIPVVLMGYLNPFMQFGRDALLDRCRAVGVDGMIIVDFPPEESHEWVAACAQQELSFIPLVSPTTNEERIPGICALADGFVYIISSMGVTGGRSQLNVTLPGLVSRVRKCTNVPLAVGFGISTAEHFATVASISDGVVIGSKFIETARNANGNIAKEIEEYAGNVSLNRNRGKVDVIPDTPVGEAERTNSSTGNKFGSYGGQFAPETLIYALRELETSLEMLKSDSSFWSEFESFYPFVNRPSPLQLAENLTKYCGGARIWLKREDLNHTGSHKINNALGQVLLARRLGKERIIAETGAGQHGVATATVCAHFNMPCKIYMGATDCQRQALNVFRIKLLGAEVVPVVRGGSSSGEGTLKDAINEAMRDWVTNVENTHYLVGSAIGPHPFPSIVKEFQSVIGKECKTQFREKSKKSNPDVLVACVGGGSNAIGLFAPFFEEKTDRGNPIRLIGVEAGGDGIETGRHSAPLTAGKPGVLHGCNTYLIQDPDGQIAETSSISAGLDYPGVGPEHSFLKDSGRAEYVAATDAEALTGLLKLSQLEGIIPALETAHAVHYAMVLAKVLDPDQDIVIGVSGRGDKDVEQVQKLLPKFDLQISSVGQ